MTTPFPQAVLGLKYEILINGTWIDISRFVMQGTDTVLTVPRADETSQATFGQATFTVLNSDGRFSPENPAGAYAPYIARNVQCRISVTATSATGDSYGGYRFWGEVTSWIPQQDDTGKYQYCAVTACGPLRRYNQGAAIGSPLHRYYARLQGTSGAPYGAWPCEDGSQSTELGSMLNGVPAMAVTGSPNLASDASFGGSNPVPVINGSTWHGQTQAAETPPGTGSLTEITPGTYTWTCPPGVTAVNVAAIGAGGGGGFCANTALTGGGGGGGGGYAANTAVSVTPGTTYTYAVGAGGAPGSLNFNGGPGGASYFDGDTVGVIGEGGQGGLNAAVAGGGGAGGGPGASGVTLHSGGSGGTAETVGVATFTQTIVGNTGATGGGTNVQAGTVAESWTCPSGTSTVNVQALGAGGGGGQGAGASGGGNGGGGAAISSGAVNVTAGTVYAPYAGNGGAGGSGSGHGNQGGNSGFTGDSGSAVEAGGGMGGAPGGGGGSAGTVVSGSGYAGGSGGGAGATSSTAGGGGGGGGGAADSARSGDSGTAGSGRNPGSGAGEGGRGGYGAVLPGGTGSSAGSTGTVPSGTNPGYGGGGGGGGAVNDQSGGANGGAGGPGWLSWSWTNDGPTGGGGGASGGPLAAGGNGSANGGGGTAPSGGGTGGAMSKNGTAPGGGGGGQDPSGSAPGAGAPGMVTLSWDGGAVSPVPADIIRFLLHVNANGAADGAVVARAVTFGTIQTVDFIYHTALNGSLEVTGYTGATVYFDQTECFSDLNGQPVCVSFALTAGSGG
jgi:hypothetical protein